VPVHPYGDRLAVGIPKASADSVLTEGMDGQPSMAGLNGLLDLRFELP
jgi:hypothetical protein